MVLAPLAMPLFPYSLLSFYPASTPGPPAAPSFPLRRRLNLSHAWLSCSHLVLVVAPSNHIVWRPVILCTFGHFECTSSPVYHRQSFSLKPPPARGSSGFLIVPVSELLVPKFPGDLDMRPCPSIRSTVAAFRPTAIGAFQPAHHSHLLLDALLLLKLPDSHATELSITSLRKLGAARV